MPSTEDSVALSSRRGRGVLVATVLASGMAFLDSTVVNVALPTLEAALGASVSQLQWTVDAYLLALSALLLLGGALGDLYGRKRVFVVGLVVFTAASVLCGLAPGPTLLILSRGVQGVGAALLVPTSLALLRAAIRDEDRGRAIGLWSGWSGVTTALGPVLAGWLIIALSWRWVFFLNVPIGAVALAVGWRCIPDNRDEPGARLDIPGAVLATVGLGGVVFGLIEGPATGFGAMAWAALALGGAACVAFGVVEARKQHPMVPLGIFRSRQFSGANLTTFAVYFGLGGAMFLLMLQLQRVLGYSPLQAGAALVPFTLLLLVLSPVAGRLTRTVGHRLLMTVGPLTAAVGLALLVLARPGSNYLTGVLPGVLVFGLGMSATVAPLTDAVFQSSPRALAGVASGVNNAVARVAGLLAVALLPWSAGIAGAGGVTRDALSRGFDVAMWLSAVACALGGLVAFATVDRSRGTEGVRPVR